MFINWLVVSACLYGLAGGRYNEKIQSYVETLLGSDGSSFLESHLNSGARAFATSKKKVRYRDLDCENVEAMQDNIEQECSRHRWNVLKDIFPAIEEVERNRSQIAISIDTIDKSLHGTYMDTGINELEGHQFAMLYGLKWNDTVFNRTVRYKGIVNQSDVLAQDAFSKQARLEGVFDTEWTNFLTVLHRLQNFTQDFTIDDFNTVLALGMKGAEIRQRLMMQTLSSHKDDISRMGNGLMAGMADTLNDEQSVFEKKIADTSSRVEKLIKEDTDNTNSASAKLDKLVDFFSYEIPQKMVDYNDRLRTEGRDSIKQARSEFFAHAKDNQKAFNADLNRQTDIFKLESSDSAESENKAWKLAEGTRQTELKAKIKEYARKANDLIADIKLSDAKDMITISDMTSQMGSQTDELVFSSQDAVTKVTSDLKQVKDKAEKVGLDVNKEFDTLIQSLVDGTTDQREKISNFLKLAADSNASELAALVQSASRMRDSLTSSQSGAYTEISQLIANLQVQLAKKDQEEGNVSVEVQKAIQLGQATSDAKLDATAAGQSSENSKILGSIQQDAADVANSLREGSISDAYQSGSSEKDIQGAAKAERDFLRNQAAMSKEQSLYIIKKLRALARDGAGSTDKTMSDASEAARAILASLSGVRDGTNSLSSALASRDGSMKEKLAAIARQLGTTDDAMANMYNGLLKTRAQDADSKITSLLSKKIGTARKIAVKDGAFIDAVAAGIDDASEDTEDAEKQAINVDAAFKSQMSSIASSLDSQFANRMERDKAIKNAVKDGLGEVRTKLISEAYKAFQTVEDSRKAIADDSLLQSDKSIDSIRSDVSEISKGQFGKVTDAFGLVRDGQSDMTLAEAALNNNFERIKGVLASAHDNTALANAEIDGRIKRMGEGISALKSSFASGSLADISALQTSNAQLQSFIKTIPRRISEQIKVIEDSFVETEQGISLKAKYLETQAVNASSEDERAAAAAQLAKLNKSRELMRNFKDMQQQAMREIFAREAGLLGKSSGTMGDLQYIANSVSDMLNSNEAVTELSNQAIRKSEVDVNAITGSLGAAIESTHTAIQRDIDVSNSQSNFSSTIANAQISSLIDSANRDGALAAQTAADVDDSANEAIKAKRAKLAELAQVLQANQAKLSESAAEAINSASSSNNGLKAEIAANAAERDTQIFMVKNAVQQLLQTWSHYAESENRKFRRWNKTEDEFVGQFIASMATVNQSALTDVSKTSAAVEGDRSASDRALHQFVNFKEGLSTSMEQMRDAIGALKVSSEASADQVGEQIYGVDASDKHLDDKARQTATEEGKKLEQDATQDIMDSFKIKSVAFLEGASAVEESDEALRNDISNLEHELGV